MDAASDAAGDQFTCARHADGNITCWGLNTSGQTDAPAGSFEDLEAGGSFACALDSSDDVICWGKDNYSQASQPGSTFSQVWSGKRWACRSTN